MLHRNILFLVDCLFYSEILELYEMTAQQDLAVISGSLTYRMGNNHQFINLKTVQDTEEESNEVFTVRLLNANNDATLSLSDNIATVTGKL